MLKRFGRFRTGMMALVAVGLLGAGVAANPAMGAQGDPSLQELWKQFPLDAERDTPPRQDGARRNTGPPERDVLVGRERSLGDVGGKEEPAERVVAVVSQPGGAEELLTSYAVGVFGIAILLIGFVVLYTGSPLRVAAAVRHKIGEAKMLRTPGRSTRRRPFEALATQPAVIDLPTQPGVSALVARPFRRSEPFLPALQKSHIPTSFVLRSFLRRPGENALRTEDVITPGVEKVESAIEGLQAELEAVQARRAEYEAFLEDLKRQQEEAAARLELSQKQTEEFSARLLEQKAELEKARQQEAADEAFREALRRRDAIGSEAAAAINVAVDGLLDYARHQETLLKARDAASPGVDVTQVREPQELVGAWQRLIELLRPRIDEKPEDDVNEAAA